MSAPFKSRSMSFMAAILHVLRRNLRPLAGFSFAGTSVTTRQHKSNGGAPMKRTRLILAAILLSGVTFFALAKPAAAAPPVRLASTPAYHPNVNHMPGWDWQRTYPWSAYNYGRN